MSSVFKIFQRPVDQVVSKNFTVKDLEKRADNLKKQIVQQIEQSPQVSIQEQLQIAAVQVQAFVQEFEGDSTLSSRAAELGRELTRAVQQQTALIEARRAKEAFAQFKADVESTAKQTKRDYAAALDSENADVLTVVAQARGQIGQILLIEAPNRHETTAAISQNAVEDLQADLQKRAIVAQAKKVDRAFSSFLSTGKLIAEAGKYMAQTQKKWAEKAQVLNRAIHVVRELASQEVAIPNANVFDRKTVRGQREALTRELQTLHTLQGLDAPQGNFADSAALSPRMKEKACKVDELLGKTDAARTMAMSINSAKRAADIYEEAKRNLEGGIDDLFQKLILVSQSVEECQPESANQIDQELAQARETLESLRGDLEGIELMRGSLAKVIPGVDEFQALVAGVSNRFSEVSGRLTSIESRLRQLRTLETAFQNGTFDDLMLYHFRNVPESLYARLKDIVADKLKDLDTEEAQQYRAAVKNLLFRLGKGVEGKFDLPQLKRTWGEAFAAFFSWLVSLIFGQSKPVESAPVRLDRAEQPRQQLLQPQQARSEDAEEEIGDDLFDDSWDDLDFEPSNSSEMDDLRRYYGIAPSTNPIDEEVPSAAEAYRQKASANVVVTS